MGSVKSVLSGGLAGGKKKKSPAPAPAPQEKEADPNLRSQQAQATEDARTAEDRAQSRRKRVSNQVQVGKAGARSGLRTALTSKPTRSGVSIQ